MFRKSRDYLSRMLSRRAGTRTSARAEARGSAKDHRRLFMKHRTSLPADRLKYRSHRALPGAVRLPGGPKRQGPFAIRRENFQNGPGCRDLETRVVRILHQFPKVRQRLSPPDHA